MIDYHMTFDIYYIETNLSGFYMSYEFNHQLEKYQTKQEQDEN